MQSADLDEIEQALGISLPAAYRAAATSGRLEELPNSDARSVVAITRAFRNGDLEIASGLRACSPSRMTEAATISASICHRHAAASSAVITKPSSSCRSLMTLMSG